MTALPRPVWVALPVEDGEPVPRLDEGDSYVVELTTGEQLWANYTRLGGFVPCDDEGNEIVSPGFSCPMPLDNVTAVQVRGYVPGFGPSCPKAGAAPEIHLVVIQPGQAAVVARPLLDRVIAEAMTNARRMLGERYHAHPPVNFREPFTSSERDTRHQESL